MRFLLISAQTAIISQGTMNRLIFTVETACVYCAVRAEYLHIIEVILSLKGLKTILGLIDCVLLTAVVIYYTLLDKHHWIKTSKALEHYNISSSIIRVIKRLYENSFSKIKIGKQLSSGSYITKGLRQGCSLSPTLFKIYIQNALENWQKKCAKMGLEIQDTTIYSTLFADDQLLIAQDYEDLEYMARKLIEEYELWGLKLNVKKN